MQQPCGEYVSPEACRLLLFVSMGSIYIWARSGMPTMMDKAMASLCFIPQVVAELKSEMAL